ncbi:transposase family protein [Mycobacterium ulcerans str. Harvey]|uniref:Transposase family protein n=1 Tax=Mycobacterium ulcerans str. Harvey TaxID=1299332 RepID=A0ABN0R615_MYCUL|nr:transposase family protein [Mycobacterium ulcerans str. Harvey]
MCRSRGRQELRGALRAKATATHLVSVFAHRVPMVLGNSLSRESNEIPAYVPFTSAG